MATFNGTAIADVANAVSGTLTGFSGGTVAELQDATGDDFNPGEGADTIIAGAGDDGLNGSRGADDMRGGAGNDLFIYFEALDIEGDTIDGGANTGADQIQVGFSGTADFSAVSIASTGATSIEFLNLFGEVAHSLIFNGSQVSPTGLSASLGIQGNGGADVITFNNVRDTFSLANFTFALWNEAEDRIVVNTVSQTIFTGATIAEEYNGGANVDFIGGSLGADTLRGGAESDLYTYTDAAQIIGDAIDGGDQAGTVTGDLININFAGAADFTTATIASTGVTSIERLAFRATGDITATFNASQFGLTGIAANLLLADVDVGAATLIINDVSGTFDVNSFVFDQWNSDNRVILNASSSATLTGTGFREEFNGSFSGDTLRGGDGADTLRGGFGDDTFRYVSASEITGDVIDGGASGGSGDVLQVEFSGTADFTTATISTDGFTGIERIVLSGGGVHNLIFDAGLLLNSLSTTLELQGDNGAADTVTFNNIGSNFFFSLATFRFADWQAQDRLVLNCADNGSDVTGTSQIDVVNGGAGRDEITGTLGADSLNGGAGSDNFNYTANAQIAGDRINGGTDAGDVGIIGDTLSIRFTGLADFRAATISTSGSSSIESISTFGAGIHDVRFNASQLGGGGLAVDLIVSGSTSGTDNIYFDNVTGSINLGQLRFGEWADTIDRVYLTGGSGAELIHGSSQFDVIAGGSGLDTLNGGAGNDTLNGGTGADSMNGGAGSDTYIIDTAGDVVTEALDAGDDLVATSLSYQLRANFERLTFTGSTNATGIGNALANTLIGNIGDNILDGGIGADAMRGGAGNDRYTFDNAGDTASELIGEGTDTVISSVAHTLRPNFENLTIIGTATNAFGSSVANILTGGNALGNILNGKEANDIMTGGAGLDTFIFDTAFTSNIDRITDFNPVDDAIRLDDVIFSALPLGTLAETAFQAGTAAADPADRIIYDQATGRIFYDADGLGGTAQVLFAILDNKPTTLSHIDFVVT